jgi:membrane-bound acyltransferase YfiQ involved in biofilm formation
MLKNLFRTPLGLLLIVAAFVTEALVLNPETYETYAMSWHGFFVGLLAFFFGFLGVHTGASFWNTLRSWRWVFLALALGLFGFRYSLFDLLAPNYLRAIESNVWIFAVFGFAYKYLNHPGKALSYLSQAAYPVYILHMVFLYLGSLLIMPLEIPAAARFIFIVVFTLAGCFGTYELIRRIKFIRPLFGLRTKKKYL